ncbi:MAG TPA: hypothetical protein VF502_16550 [Stellaceae bacterium]
MVVTNERIEAAIRQLERLIAAAEVATAPRSEAASRELVALKTRQQGLHLLMLARVVERRKKVVRLERWRYGFDAPRGPRGTLREG